MDTHTEILTFRTAQHHLDVDSTEFLKYISRLIISLNVTKATLDTAQSNFTKTGHLVSVVGSGGVDFLYTGKINIAFKYTGSENLALDRLFR
jgi:hypothetical protein